MGYRREDYEKVNALLAERRAAAESAAAGRLKALYAKLPEVEEIDKELRRTAAKIADVVIDKSGDPKVKIAKIQAENLALQARREEILKRAGYPADYTEPRYTCEKCHDTGFVGTKECVCRRRALILSGYEGSGIGELLKTQTFETFSPAYNSGSETIARAYSVMKSYAEGFTGSGDANLLLIGGTGLGKTHLSTAAAGVIIERGFDVKYETAQNMFSEFERWQFYRREGDEDPTSRYFDCDLLIIDDLGCELQRQFASSCLLNLLNTRAQYGRSMIISTNLNAEELRRRYDDRITSRLFGGFSVLLFEGRDVRAEKLRGK